MSSKTAHLGVMTADEFKNRTKASSNVCGFKSHFKSRGSSMNSIDLGLETWDRLCLSGKDTYNESQKVETLLFIQYSCEIYLNNKSGKNSSLSQHRKSVVRELHVASEAAVNFVRKRFVSNVKTRQGLGAQTKGLEPGYAQERRQYEHFGKQSNPYSGSKLHDMPNFTTASTGQFIAEGSSRGAQRVEFMKRDERLKHLVIVKEGMLFQDGKPYTCKIDRNDLWAATYAIDRHGNLFSKKAAEASRANLRFNHSSYCSGKEIICAGTLACIDGILLAISNLSGHYRPDAQALRSAVILLGEEEIDMDEVAVEGFGVVTGDKFAKASTLAAGGPPAPADWKHNPATPNRGRFDCCQVDYKGKTYEVVQPG